MGYCGWCPYLNKWVTFTASIGVALTCGLTYTFSIWSGALKAAYGLRQDQLELIASAANAGGYFAVFSGLTYDALEHHKKFGPRFVLLLGLVANCAGYLGLWAAVTGLFRAQYWQLAALAALAANGGTWGDTTILVSNVRNFPSSRGSVVGVLKAGIGLSGSLFASVYSGAFYPDKARFLLFLALAPVGVGLAALPFVNTCLFVQRSELESGTHVFTAEGRFIFAFQALGTLGVYLITGTLFSSLHAAELTRSARLWITCGAGLLLLPLLLIPYGSGGLLSRKAALHHELSHYPEGGGDGPEQGEEAEERAGGGQRNERDEEAGGGGSHVARAASPGAAGADGGSLTQPLLEPGMRRQEPPMADLLEDLLGDPLPALQPDPEAPQPPAEGSKADAGLAGSSGGSAAAAWDAANPMAAVVADGADGGAPAAASAARERPPSPFAAPAAQRRQLPELSPLECLRDHDFWLLFLVISIGMGSGLALLNNLAQLVKALSGGGPALEVTPVLVSLFSVANCGGRMALGYFPERLLHARGTPRLLFLPAVAALMAGACAALAFARLPHLYPLAALTGFAFGGLWSLFPSLISELFGLTRFAANYALAMLAPALGSFGLAAGLAGLLYEAEARRQGREVCLGPACFRPAFLALAALGLVATGAAGQLYRRNLALYAAEAAELHAYDEETQRRAANGGSSGSGGGQQAD